MSQTYSTSFSRSHQLPSRSPANSNLLRGRPDGRVAGTIIVRETRSLSPVRGRGKTRILTSRWVPRLSVNAENGVVAEFGAIESASPAKDASSDAGPASVTNIALNSDTDDKFLDDPLPALVSPSFLVRPDVEIKAPPILPATYPMMPDEHLKVPLVTDKQDQGTPDGWVKRDGRLIRLTGKHPFNCEAPLQGLFDAGFLTPASLFFVRNHGAVPHISVHEAQSWKIEIGGLVKNPMTLSLAELQSGMGGRLPTVTLPITLVCAGNRRREQNVVRKSVGFNWGAAGLSTALFTGIYLADLLDYVGVAKGESGKMAKHVIFEGGDKLPDGPYGTSQKLAWARDKTKGMLVAWRMNGLPLEPDHGYPIRLVVPGQIGGRSVKWLRKIEVSEKESQHHLHFWDNKVLPTQLTPEVARKERHWWYDPTYIITDLNVNSAIVYPMHDEKVDVTSLLLTKDPFSLSRYTFRGYAYSGGGRRVSRVEISFDEGKTWTLAQITYPEDLYRAVIVEDDTIWGTLDLTERETCFCWCFWKFDAEIAVLAADGVNAVMVRAMDESLALQPRDMYWSVTGMMNNWWFRVAIHKSQAEDGKTTLRFEHPTLPTKDGGWMQRMKDEGGVEAILTPTFSIKAAAELAEAGKEKDKKKRDEVVMTKEGVNRVIKLEELKTHSGASQPWFVINGEVYDGTGFLKQHPGGPDSITLVAGEDASEDFMAIHSADGKKQLIDFHIGTLERAGGAKLTERLVVESTVIEPIFLCKTNWKSAKLVTISHISHDTRVYKFALQSPDQDLGLPTGQHVYARMKRKCKDGKVDAENGFVQRAYTPLNNQAAKGFIDILVKIYFPTPQFPLGGKMTGCFAELEIGDSIELKGPLGSFVWKGDGRFSWRGQERKCRALALICGGSGITPIIQVIRGVLEDETDTETKLWLVDANRTEKDILLYDELQNWARVRSDRFKVHHVLSKAPPGFDGSVGYVDERHIRENLPPPSDDALVLICGPPGLIENAAKPNLMRRGWNLEENLVIF